MRARGGCPAGVPCFIVTSLPDAQAAARLYCDLFGWTAEEQMPADAPATTSRRSSTAANVAGISSQPSGAPANAVWSTYIAVDDADDAADGVRAAGGSVLSAPFDVFDAGRMAVCADPQGAVLAVAGGPAHRRARRQRAGVV
ncbi:MAG TPA: VOC family protein [Solirubrobacteraceae bacterium]|nr:VOC family protein [Solirubrobacteraceae bacterium]